jgi:hypothetical protein
MLVHTHRQPILLKQGEENLAFEPAMRPLPTSVSPTTQFAWHTAPAVHGSLL